MAQEEQKQLKVANSRVMCRKKRVAPRKERWVKSRSLDIWEIEIPRAARTVAKRKSLDQSVESLDTAINSGDPSFNGGTQTTISSTRSNDVPLRPIPKNGLYILCSETKEITDPELLRSPPSLIVALHELEVKDQLYERIGRAYGMWILTAPVEVQFFNHIHFPHSHYFLSARKISLILLEF